MLKKIISLVITFLLCLSLTACDETTKNTSYTTAPNAQVHTEAVTEAPNDILEWVQCTGYEFDESQPVKNIVLMIGDGMGENIMKNAEIVKGSKLATCFLEHKCYVGTDSLNGVTDSAAASTAISCGVKTRNQFIGVDENRQPVETIIEFAKARGLKTGLVDTHIIPHATPAGMIAHEDYRGDFNTILKQMINAEVDVLFGGGNQYSDTPKMKNRLDEKGYRYITTTEEIDSLEKGTPAFGCFSYYDLNASYNPSLTTMTAKALNLLEGDDGFFLMVEASHIDIYEAEMDMEKTMSEMQAFDKTIDYVLKWAQQNPGTLVLITADHETGGVIVPDSGLAKDINNDCFTSGGEHTGADVLLFAAGAQADKIITKDRIENTDISNIMRKALNDTYGEKEVKLLNQ